MTTYYVDTTTGDNADTGLTEALAWATITYALSQVAAGDTVYVKASGTYNESASGSTVGGNGSVIRFIGYTSSLTDRGKVTISATGANALVGGSLSYYVWENFIFTGGSSIGVDLGITADSVFFYNCEFTSNGAAGLRMDNNCTAINCEFLNNTGPGADPDGANWFAGCIFGGNGQGGLGTGSTNNAFYKCVFYNNGATYDSIGGSTQQVLACTFDGDGTSGDAIGAASVGSLRIADNIFHDYGGDACVTATSTSGGQGLAGYNLFSSITGSNYTNDLSAYGAVMGLQDVSGAPAFIDEAGDDYRPSNLSPAVDAQLKPGGIT